MYDINERLAAATPQGPHPGQDIPARPLGQTETYYNEPSLKKSPYRWKTALSFLAEAAGGGPQVLAALIHLAGRPEDRGLVRRGRYLALAGTLLAPALLVSELHTPRRWLHMLRIFRPTSAMSIGNMALTSFGVFGGLTMIGQGLEDLGRCRPGRLLGQSFMLPAALAGGMLCLYPGTEIEETSVPLWAGSHPLLAPLFAATGLSAGAAALTLAAGTKSVAEESRDRLNELAATVLAVQLGAAMLVEKTWRAGRFSSLRASRDPLHRLGVMTCGLVAPLVLRLLPAREARRRQENRMLAAAVSLVGSYLVYETTLEAGNSSAASAGEYLRATRSAGPGTRQTKKAASGVPGLIGLALLSAAGAAYFLWQRRAP